MFVANRPSSYELRAFIAKSAELPLSYSPVGIAQQAPAGFSLDKANVVLGCGEAAFTKAKAALLRWAHFELGWVEMFPPGAPVVPGTVVAVVVSHLGFWSVNGCKVVYAVENVRGVREFGFAYGTLTNHAESGEEVFKVVQEADTGEVVYTIRAVSKPHSILARCGYPVARALQARFRRDSTAAMQRAVG
jgi:uncharacterized protein (UPF0548 family)